MAITVVNTKHMLFNLIFNVAKYYHLAKTQRIAGVAGAWKWGAQERTGARPFFLAPTTSKRLLRRLPKERERRF